MFERFTKQAREIVRSAEAEARQLGAEAIGSEHLLIATVALVGTWPFTDLPYAFGYCVDASEPVADPDPVSAARIRELLRTRDADAEALAAIGISVDEVRRKVEEALGPGVWEQATRRRRLRFTDDAKEVLELALREALELRMRRITGQEVLLALLRHDRAARHLVAALGASPDAAYERVRGSLTQMSRLATR